MKMGLPGRPSRTLFERMSDIARGGDKRAGRAHDVHGVDETQRPQGFARPTEIPTREID